MTAPAPSKRKSRRKTILAVLAVVIIVILLVPLALAGGFTVPLETISFDETTGSLAYSNVRFTSEIVTACQYYFSIRAGGMVRTSDTDVSSSRGTTNVTISIMLTNPSNQTIDLGNTNINGAIGARSHTLYLSIDQGVHANGEYKLDIII